MNDYTKALHQRFCREPEGTEEERELTQAEQALKETLAREQRRLLLGLAGELESYSFDADMEE